jgi:hypothetical protein
MIAPRHASLAAKRPDCGHDPLVVRGHDGPIDALRRGYALIHMLNHEFSGFDSERFSGEASGSEAGRNDRDRGHVGLQQGRKLFACCGTGQIYHARAEKQWKIPKVIGCLSG